MVGMCGYPFRILRCKKIFKVEFLISGENTDYIIWEF
jgi:hypothetical protein